MRISYNWLQELLPELTQDPKEVAELLTMHSYETEVVETWNIDPAIQVVQIAKIEPHPNADRLRLATVTDGTDSVRVVCGAPNIEEGQVVPYAPPGATVVDGDGKPFEITEATIRGEVSPGMLSSLRELGLGSDHGGIFVLPEDTPLGTPLAEHIPNDAILEAEVTPNRAHDSLSHLGVARELAAILNLAVAEPSVAELPAPKNEVDGRSIEIEDDQDTPRYINLVVSGAKNGSSPLWIQRRLIAGGIRPINRVVDVTNYVTLEIGNPSHAFDANKLADKKIGVRKARAGEELQLLDETNIALSADDLVIANGDTPIALAGIMGGAGSEVEEETADLVVEVACFRAYQIQESAAAHNLRTEASARFSKGIDASLAGHAAKRLAALYAEVAGAVIEGLLDTRPEPEAARVIQFDPAKASRIAGVEISSSDAKAALERLRCVVEDGEEAWSVTVPHDRLDVQAEHDLVEEVIRLHGLESIPAKQPTVPAEAVHPPVALAVREQVRDILVGQGVAETYNYSFEPAVMANTLDIGGDHVRLVDPADPDQSQLRTSLLPGLLKNFATNKDDFHKKFNQQEKALFEIGHVYALGDEGRVPGVIEEQRIAGMLVGSKDSAAQLVQTLLDELQVEFADDVVLFLDEIPAEKIKYRVPVAAFELSLDTIMKRAPEQVHTMPTLAELTSQPETPTQFQAFSKYPSVLRDLSFFVEAGVSVEDVQELIERVGGELVVDTDLFDQFQPTESEPMGLAFHIEYQANDKTLTTEEVNEVHGKIIQALEDEFGAEMR